MLFRLCSIDWNWNWCIQCETHKWHFLWLPDISLPHLFVASTHFLNDYQLDLFIFHAIEFGLLFCSSNRVCLSHVNILREKENIFFSKPIQTKHLPRPYVWNEVFNIVVIVCHNKQTGELKWFFQVIFINNNANRNIKLCLVRAKFDWFFVLFIKRHPHGLDMYVYSGISQCSTLSGLLQQHAEFRCKQKNRSGHRIKREKSVKL